MQTIMHLKGYKSTENKYSRVQAQDELKAAMQALDEKIASMM